MRLLWLLLALAACGEQAATEGASTGLTTRIGGSSGAFTSFTR